MHSTFGVAMCGTFCTMATMQLDHADTISLWPTLADFAADVGVKRNTARGWKRRNSIPVKYWPAVLEMARERRAYVSPEELIRSAAQRRAAA